MAYSKPSLLIADDQIYNSNGVQQGDPLGPLLFALTIDPVVRNISSRFNVWYLDDATIGGPVASVLKDLENLIPSLNSLGLSINPLKSEIANIGFTPEDFTSVFNTFSNVLPNIRRTLIENLKILGSPISNLGVESSLYAKTSSLVAISNKLAKIDSHSGLFFLRNCFAIPKLLFILRSAPCFFNLRALESFDFSLKSSLESICNITLDEIGWQQATLPISHGGIGIRSSVDLSIPAYLSSVNATNDLVQEILQSVTESSMDTESVAAESRWQGMSLEIPENTHAQGQWDRILCDHKINSLKPKLNQHRLACLLAASQPYSGAWLTAIPMASIGTLMDNDCVRISVSLRLGLPICRTHQCRCGLRVDPFGHHPLSCSRSAGRFPRHAAINDTVSRALTKAGFPNELEPVGLDRGDGKRPDGMSIFPFEKGKCLIWDATCSDTFSAKNLIASAAEPGSVAKQAELTKHKKYRVLAKDHQFTAVAVETSGVIGPQTLSFLRRLGSKLVVATKDPNESIRLFQGISLAIMRGNCQSIRCAF
ncbi:uncharacterized protein LOC115230736 [Octopus sinensis]|uniref:Uncharacterized protein LOC115230736 n=1 Tax=Octopus sinensis TaxID=2607531 RepID=A0A6P7TWF2_9MOLL|nr:uncharacterized protein LOC115230736 [Octopus sinensis]